MSNIKLCNICFLLHGSWHVCSEHHEYDMIIQLCHLPTSLLPTNKILIISYNYYYTLMSLTCMQALWAAAVSPLSFQAILLSIQAAAVSPDCCCHSWLLLVVQAATVSLVCCCQSSVIPGCCCHSWLSCTNFGRHLVANANFHALIARHPALVIIIFRRVD